MHVPDIGPVTCLPAAAVPCDHVMSQNQTQLQCLAVQLVRLALQRIGLRKKSAAMLGCSMLVVWSILALLKGWYPSNTVKAEPDSRVQTAWLSSVDVISLPHAHATISLRRGSPRMTHRHVEGQTVPVSGGLLTLGEYAVVLQVRSIACFSWHDERERC